MSQEDRQTLWVVMRQLGPFGDQEFVRICADEAAAVRDLRRIAEGLKAIGQLSADVPSEPQRRPHPNGISYRCGPYVATQELVFTEAYIKSLEEHTQLFGRDLR